MAEDALSQVYLDWIEELLQVSLTDTQENLALQAMSDQHK